MNNNNPLWVLPGGELFETLLPDMVLSFAFFTSLVYAVLGKRFDHQRSAVGMSAALGLALSVGLVWWESRMGVSIRNLGPIAIGFAVVVLAMVMFKAIGRIGGSWAGAGFAVGVSLLIAVILGFDLPFDPQILYSLMTLGLIVGFLAFLFHHTSKMTFGQFPKAPVRTEIKAVRHDVDTVKRDWRFGEGLRRGIKNIMIKSRDLGQRPEEASDVMRQIHRLLPAEGWLTDQLARLRRKAYFMRKGHIARIKELQQVMNTLPAPKKRLASWELKKRYQELHLDQRLSRLNQAVTEFERRIRDLTGRAQKAVAQYEFKKVEGLLKEAEDLQAHNSKLLKQIVKTEEKMARITQEISQNINEVDKE